MTIYVVVPTYIHPIVKTSVLARSNFTNVSSCKSHMTRTFIRKIEVSEMGGFHNYFTSLQPLNSAIPSSNRKVIDRI